MAGSTKLSTYVGAFLQAMSSKIQPRRQAATAAAKAAAMAVAKAKAKAKAAARKEAAKKQAATAAALQQKKMTKVQLTRAQKIEIGELTEENLKRHNFKYYPRKRLADDLQSFSSMWAQSTVSLKFMRPQKEL